MKRFMFPVLVALAAITGFLWAFPGSAQTVTAPAADTTVSFQGLFDTWIVPLLSAGLSAVAAWVGKLIHDIVGKWIGDSNAKSLETAIGRGLQWALDQLAEQVDQRDILDIDVKNAAIAGAIAYVTKFNPDTLKIFGLNVDPQSLKTRVEAQLAELLGVDYHVNNGLEPLPPRPAPAPVPAPSVAGGVAVPVP